MLYGRLYHELFIIMIMIMILIVTFYGPPCSNCAAPRVWNELPSSVFSISSLAVFKKRLKTELFEQYLRHCHKISAPVARICNASLHVFYFD